MLSPRSSHGSPLFDFLTAFAPRRLKDLFRLCEYLYFNSAQIYAALQKFCTYPITSITYDTTNEALQEKYKNLHDTKLKTLRVLHRGAIDKFVYGNAFHSMYTPFVRFLKCPKCAHLSNINTLDYKFALKKMLFTYTCTSCNARGVNGEVVDRKITRADKMSVIRWDPKLMDIDYNPITGHSEYFYTIPKELKERINKGNKHLINTMPLEFLKAIRDDKLFKFKDGQVFHIKMDAPAGIEAQWGFPPLTSTVKLFFYAAVLRKANECVALSTLIETVDGLVPADDVRVGTLVRTHTGQWQPVTDKWYRDARAGEVGRKVTLSGLRSLPATFSPKHPVLTLQRTQQSRRSDTKDKQTSSVMMRNPHLYEEAYCPAGKINVGDYVLYPRRLPASEQVIDVAAASGLRRVGGFVYGVQATDDTLAAFDALEQGQTLAQPLNARKVAKRIHQAGKTPLRFAAERPLTQDLAYVLGWYTGDGACNKGTVIFSLGMDDNHEPLVAALEREFGGHVGNHVGPRGNLRTITISDVLVRALVKGLVPGTAREKRVPLAIMNATDTVKLAFLRGYHEADGHVGKTRNMFGTSSRGLAYDVYRLLLHLGCIATVDEQHTRDSVLKDGRVIRGGTHYHVNVAGPSRTRLQQLWDGQDPVPVTAGKSGFFRGDFFATRVSSTADAQEARYIDFKVAVDETFCVPGGATHNCIALDYVVPLRIISPKQTSSNADPVLTISLSRWAEQMKTDVKKWRRDPLHIMWSPVAAEVTHLGGQARSLMVQAEVQAAEDNIIAALGLPREFIYGGFSALGSGIQLRVLENQLVHQTGDLNDLLQWITDRAARWLGWPSIKAELAPFKFIDDVQQKTLLLQLNAGPEGPWISRKTIGEAFEVDPAEEARTRKQETLNDARMQQELQIEMQKMQNTLASQVQAQTAMGQQGLKYDQQQVIAQADQLVQQMQALDPGSRQSQMHALEIEDLVMYSVVKKRMEDATTAANHEALSQARAAGQPVA